MRARGGFNGFTVTAKSKTCSLTVSVYSEQSERMTLADCQRPAHSIRQRARTSLRRRKKPAKPGSPPSVHSRDSFATLKKHSVCP